jgi:hypothetical protein
VLRTIYIHRTYVRGLKKPNSTPAETTIQTASQLSANAEPPGDRSSALVRAVDDFRRDNRDLVEDLARRSRLEIEIETTTGGHQRVRRRVDPCYLIGAAVLVVFTLSLAVSLWWSISRQDVSGGFTMGAYMVAAASLPLGFVSYRHWETCHCALWSWVSLSPPF